MDAFPSGQRGQTVNLLRFRFGGPNPPASTNQRSHFLRALLVLSDIFRNRGVAQLVARDIWDVEAAGSNPVTPTSYLAC